MAPQLYPRHAMRVAAVYPHDHWAFTQGLAWHTPSRTLYESTGRYGDSSLRSYRLDDTSAPSRDVRRVELHRKIFAEGLAIVVTPHGERLYQLTWRERVVLVHDLELRLLGQLPFPANGWGLAACGGALVASDGSAELRWLDPATLHEQRRLAVHADGQPQAGLNDLEYIPADPAAGASAHFIANIFQSDRLARIDAATGAVIDWLNLRGLLPWYRRLRHRTVLNGLAWQPEQRRLLVTGKFWPRIYALELPPLSGGS